MSEIVLKPCPFCGGKAEVVIAPEVWVRCEDCGACSEMLDNAEEAVEAWNRRVTE